MSSRSPILVVLTGGPGAGKTAILEVIRRNFGTGVADVGTTRDQELARYATVIHLRTPKDGEGYDHSNLVRTEDPEEAARVDDAIHRAWEGHPRRCTVESTPDFLDKVVRVLALVAEQLPDGALARGPVPGITRNS